MCDEIQLSLVQQLEIQLSELTGQQLAKKVSVFCGDKLFVVLTRNYRSHRKRLLVCDALHKDCAHCRKKKSVGVGNEFFTENRCFKSNHKMLVL